MKKRVLLSALALILVLSLLPVSALAAVFGDELQTNSGEIAEGASLTSGVSYGSAGYIRENYITYKPNETVTPVVVYGSKICNYGNFKTMAELLEKSGLHVIGGINGDYYDTETYAPLGIVVTNGELKASDGGHYAVAFKADGSAFISKPELQMSFTVADAKYPLASFNKTRSGSGFALYSEDFSYTTKNTSPGTDVILTVPADTKITVNCAFTATVESVVKSSGALELPSGKLVLSLSDDSDPWRLGALSALKAGDELTFTISCADGRLDEAQNAVGSLYKLVTSGALEPELDRTANPRTAIGIKEDGSVIFYTIDGRQSGYSSGASMEDVANRLIELGCTEATLLDGGGSTNLSAMYIGGSAAEQINSPSSGSTRSVTNYVMLVTKSDTADGKPARLGLTPSSALLLAGAKTDFRSGAADNAAFAVTLPADARLSSDIGSVDQSGLFTAPDKAGTGKISLSSRELKTVYADITVVTTPDAINVKKAGSAVSSLTLQPGSVTELSASATYGMLDLIAQNECFTWSCENVGTIDEHGVFTANAFNCEGKIVVSAGETSVTIPVVIKGTPYVLASFESGMNSFVGNASRNTDRFYVARGAYSMQLDYKLNGDRALLATCDLAPEYGYLHLWLYGDNSGNSLFLGETEAAKLDFAGWRQITVPCLAGEKLSFSVSGSGEGSIYIDHIVCSPDVHADTAAPELTLELTDGKITGTVSEDVTATFRLDGSAYPFTLRSGKISADVPEDGLPHRATLEVKDLYGNISRASVDLPAAEPSHPFADMTEHWAESSAAYLYSVGYVGGYVSGETRTFDPDTPMTRADFAVLLTKWMQLDLDEYKDIVLPFADLGDIDESYLPYVRAVYALDVIRGVNDYGVLRFAPNEALTRAQAMTMLGRVQSKGYAESDLPFSDASDVPDWSLPYVRSLVSQKVVNGHSDGTLKPNDSVTRAEVTKIIASVM